MALDHHLIALGHGASHILSLIYFLIYKIGIS